MQTILERIGYDPAQNADNGNRFLNGNGYLGVRGTPAEFGSEQQTAVNLSGIYHQKGSAWREPLNAPNPFYLSVSGASLLENAAQVRSHHMSVDISDGVFHRETIFETEQGTLTLAQERFCSMERIHMVAQRITLTCDRDSVWRITAGVDGSVWDIHGPHFEEWKRLDADGTICLTGITDDSQAVSVAWRSTLPEEMLPKEGGLGSWELTLRANESYVFDCVASVFTTKDEKDTVSAACDGIFNAPDYDAMLAEQRLAWDKLWKNARVEIEGDERAEFAVNYSLYHLMSIAPRHSQSLSVPARGLSGQTYKGAIFWDTEMFMLDFFLCSMPNVARSVLRYRIDTLPGALEKARSYGLSGAFYAWESQEGGVDGCSDYNVTDVFTGRPMRTYFRDKQVHISAAVVYALIKYQERTADETLLKDGGARVILECARFYLSLLSKRILSDTYDLNDVIGPDEYHERVNNNAYTNEMARMTLKAACDICPRYLDGLDEGELAAFADAAKHLKRQPVDPQTNVIEQFDGYFNLEDASLSEVRGRLKDPREYWGGAYGVASDTQIIKQADVIALLGMLGSYPKEIIEANYDYYEPRTEHGSSLSACMYALCACRIGRPDAAYPLFLKSAEADIQGGGKQWAGLVYIGGTHPAAAGGAYMVLLSGFMGLTFENGKPIAHPAFPKGWKRVRLPLEYRGKQMIIDVEA